MKKIYLSSALMFCAGLSFGQMETAESKAYELATEMVPSRTDYTNFDRAPGDIVWADSFEVASNWMAAGPSANDTLNGWTVNSVTGGWYFPATGAMGTSGTFARFINGEATADAIAGPFTFEYVGGANNGAIDLTGVPAPHLEFEQYGARFITVQAVEISTNGTDWFQAMSNDDIDPLTANGGSVYGQPETRRFNMVPALDLAGGSLANVHVRLFWEGAQNGPNFNNVDYGWFVDNIRMVEGEAYESALINPKYRWGVGGTVWPDGLDYHQIPEHQVSAAEFSAEILSNGGVVQTGSNVSADITGAGTYSGVSPSSDIAVGATDSFVVAPTFTPSALGTYNLVMTANQTNTDADMSNNSFSTSFDVTQSVYARDNGVEEGGISNFASNSGLSFAIGNMMEIFADWQATHIDIDVTSASTNVGQEMYGTVYRLDAGTGTYQQVAVTEPYTLTNIDLNSGPIRLKISEPAILDVAAGDDLLVMAGHLGGDGVEFATAQEVETGTVRGVSEDGSIGTLTDPSAVMVRLVLPYNLAIADNEPATINVSQNTPNPFNNNTVITYNLNEAANVSVEVIDVTGKVVATYNEGTKGSGEYKLNISADKLSNGVYFYNFKAGKYSVTKRMVVNK